MATLIPFSRSAQLIHEIDEFLDRCGEAVLVLEATLQDYFQHGANEQLTQRVDQVREIEKRADGIRREVASTLFTEMLMPDTRGDVLELLDEVDSTLDDTVHLLVKLAIERPELPKLQVEAAQALMREVVAAIQAMVNTARIYFKDPRAVRGEVHKVTFHCEEATSIGLRLGLELFDLDLPLERKSQLVGFLTDLRALASGADDTADRLVIFAVKRLD